MPLILQHVIYLDVPWMLQVSICKVWRFGQACGLPHSGGKLPDNLLMSGVSPPSCRPASCEKDPLVPQDGGKDPSRGQFRIERMPSWGKASGLPHEEGSEPVGKLQWAA